MKSHVRIATRSSRLALWQAEFVSTALKAAYPHITIELIRITTKGDKILDKSLALIGGKGLFVKEIEAALLNGDADLAVHSMKDMPADFPSRLTLAAITKRENRSDVLCSPQGLLKDLPLGARIGTSSIRRGTQLKQIRNDIVLVPVRGNIDTRLNKLDEGACDALMLAYAGLVRLGYHDRITETLEAPDFISAVGQGALGIQTCIDDQETTNGVREILHCVQSACEVYAERGFMKTLFGDCQTPLGASAIQEGDSVEIVGFVASCDGVDILKDTMRGHSDAPDELGIKLAKRLIQNGANTLLKR